MKVICIKGGKEGDKTAKGRPLHKSLEIYEGHYYNVVGECTVLGMDGYILECKPKNFIYNKNRFAPISNIDEMTFERDYNKELQPK